MSDATADRSSKESFRLNSLPAGSLAVDAGPVSYLTLEPSPRVAGKLYPLILFLHGAGERGNDPYEVMPHFPERMARVEYRERFPCFVIAPQCEPE